MIGIVDIAKKAKVSIATVSYVLNKKSKDISISKETRERVLKVAKELNYRPNIIARSLVQGKTNTIGLIVPNVTHHFFSQIIKGVGSMARKHGYILIVCDTEEKTEDEPTYINILRQRWVDGIIIAGSSNRKIPVDKLKAKKEIPIVGIDRDINGAFAYSVSLDNKTGGYEAARYLLQLGHKRIAIVSADKDRFRIDSILKREKGCRQALAEYGIKFNPSFMVGENLELDGGVRAAQKLLSLSTLPTAIFTANDMLALGVFYGLKRKGVRIPEEVSVISFDDSPTFALMDPPLTVMAQPIAEMGTLTTRMLLKLIAGEHLACPQAVLKAELVIRGSCQKPGQR